MQTIETGRPYYSLRWPFNIGLRSNNWNVLTVQQLSEGDCFLSGFTSGPSTSLGIASDPDTANHHPLYDNQAMVVYDDSGSITLSYKGHLLASSDLVSNSQRKLCFDNSTYFFAYNSGGSVWITRKGPDPGNSWSAEKRIAFVKDAPVSIDALNSRLFAVAANGNAWEVREVDPSTLGSIDSVSLFVAQGDSVSQAVVAKQTGHDVVVTVAAKQHAGVKNIQIFTLWKQSGGSLAMADSEELGGTLGAAANPTLVCDATGAFHLAWQEEDVILYRRFVVNASGVIDSLDGLPDQIFDCAGVKQGEHPCISVDSGNHPHVVWETAMCQVLPCDWPDNLTLHPYGRCIVHTMKRTVSDPKSWTNLIQFEIKDKYSRNPIIGNDKTSNGNVRIVWQTDEDGGRIHAAVGELAGGIPWRLYPNWRRKTLADTGATPVISLNSGGEPLGLFTQAATIGGSAFRKFFWSQDSGRFGFAALPGINPLEMRGGELRNELFTIGLAMSVYEDSATGAYQEFTDVSDTAQVYSLGDFSTLVWTRDFTASRVRFDIRRYVRGFTTGVSAALFETESVRWYADIRNATNDTIITTIKLGGVEKDSAYIGVDSTFSSFPGQPIYVQLTVAANPVVFPCRSWIDVSALRMQEYSMNKRGNAPWTVPSGVALHPNIPNPFSGSTTLSFTLDNPGPVRLSVHTMLGRELTVLLDEARRAGRHEVAFNTGSLPSGTYLYRLQSGNIVQTRTMTLVR